MFFPDAVVTSINKFSESADINSRSGRWVYFKLFRRPTFNPTSPVLEFELEMAWAAKRPANEPLTGLFAGPLTALFYLCLLLGR